MREELDRLGAHVAQARALLGGEAQCGRKLEFLAGDARAQSVENLSRRGVIFMVVGAVDGVAAQARAAGVGEFAAAGLAGLEEVELAA